MLVPLYINGYGCVNQISYEYGKGGVPAWQFLRDVVVPASKGLLQVDEHSIVNAIVGYFYDPSDNMARSTNQDLFMFNYDNRMTNMDQVLMPNGCLVARLVDSSVCLKRSCVGNATDALLYTDCAICLGNHANFTLACGHKFHDACLGNWSQNTCPLCRCQYTTKDCAMLMVSLVEGLENGTILIKNRRTNNDDNECS